MAGSKAGRKEAGKERMWEGLKGGREKKARLMTLASLPQHSSQGWDCVPLDDERSLVLSFTEPGLCKLVPLLLLLLLPLPPSATRSFSTRSRSDPLSERREFWREGVLGWRDSWPFFSSNGKSGREKVKQANSILWVMPLCVCYLPASACTEGWSWVLRSCAWMVSTTLLNLRLGPKRKEDI